MAVIHDIRSRTKRTNGTRKLSQIKYIARHHSATTDGNFDSFWKTWHGVKGWGTGGYHEIILRDGSVQLCYDPEEITNGVANHNTPTYHICVVGNSSFTAKQEEVFKERCLYNMKRLNVPVERVLGHREFKGAATTCPGINMDKVRQSLKNGEPVTSRPTIDLPSNVLGTVEILTKDLNVREKADFDSKVVKVLKKGDSFKAYSLVNGLYNLGGDQWVSAGKSFVKFTANKKYKETVEKEPIKNNPVSKPVIKEEEKLDLSPTQRKEIANNFKISRERGVFSSDEHEKQIIDGSMTQSRLLYLNNVIATAALVGGERA